ncbi:fanconi anemia group M protein [Marchantia polymorpha subsp. ruderalis]
MTLNTFIEDDDFDWEAAVSEIDKACSKKEASGSGSGAGAGGGTELLLSQSAQRCKQKTLLSFIRQDKGADQVRSEKQQRKIYISSHKENGIQPKIETSGLKTQLEHSIRRQDDQFNNGNHHRKVAECSFRETANEKVVETNRLNAHQEHPTECPEDRFRCQVPFDPVTASSWIYPANVPCRTYQFNITKVALFSNTLVSLPTGLGKTLIAAAVMYNYFRWFPTGKIIFAAPSRPLVVQQIEACHKVVGIPQDMTIDMTGDMSPPVRAEYWQSRRVFFVTPQCLEKDIQSGTCTSRQIVCLVIDEAHRATGNYSYCVIVRQLLQAKINYRLLALTATPGSKQVTIQAVVDNLQISCLEYRNEHDPDVSQYTHNRKIELIEVPMNAASNQVKDLLIEVLQPIVYRLCGYRVFYNRDIARLTPFEFIQAREKFRQAPPPAIPQNDYSQVEIYFGLGITLTHIFKLLFTHGMRPAYEMLQQKLQQGVLKRLGGNDKMRHLQSVMKQIVGHGAPSPKLDKVVEIISTHFSAHDPTKTRVIIFTNFRESVKDIMEILAARCTDVKAMEFIGQSSGKASKGQSQKTQQAVLQKFRAGGFNTIVATSIAEEGLDIMEVDLVICFDANISPLRMIQRMGRTGRKRDGRVVVLACEGAEKEGYLAKQSRNKALNKHMVNGGVYSFNFHPSSHMIPHSYRPAVQLVELAIEEFVPRSKKLKVKCSETAVGGLKSLSDTDFQLLEKYKIALRGESWKPSLIAFPQYQLVPTPVHKVEHSYRTRVLIDALRFMQDTSVPLEDITHCARDKEVTSSQKSLPHSHLGPPDPVKEKILSLVTPDKTNTALGELESDSNKEVLPATLYSDLDCAEDIRIKNMSSITAPNEEVKLRPLFVKPLSKKESLSLKPVSESKAFREVPVNKRESQPDRRADDLDFVSPVQGIQEVMHVKEGVMYSLTRCQNVLEFTKVITDSRTTGYTTTPQESPCLSRIGLQMEDRVRDFDSHPSEPSFRVFPPKESGINVLTAPSSISSGISDGKPLLKSVGRSKLSLSKKPLSDDGTSLFGVGRASHGLKRTLTVKSEALEGAQRSDFDNRGRAANPVSPLAEVPQNVNVDVITPNDKVMHSKKSQCMLERKQKSGVDVEIASRRLDKIASQGVVPLSPDLEIVSGRLEEIASQGVVPSSPVSKPLLDHSHISSSPVLKTPCVPKLPDVQQASITSLEFLQQHQKSPVTPLTTLGPVFSKRDSQSQINRLSTDSQKKKTPVSSFLCRINGMSPTGKFLNFSEFGLEDSLHEDRSNFSREKSLATRIVQLSPDGHDDAGNFTECLTTPQGRSTKSPSEVWEITEGKAGSASVKKPRRLKRLCKAGEKANGPSPLRKLKQLKKVVTEDLRGGKRFLPQSKAGRNHRKLRVREFLDDEAEVSDDTELSDQSDSEDMEDMEEEADGFIDTAATQALNGAVDMMAVYRRSLLTQSPAEHASGQFGHLLQTSSTLCSDETPRSSEQTSPSDASGSPGPSLGLPIDHSSPIRIDSGGKTPALRQNGMANGRISKSLSISSSIINEDQRKLELRKRKLSFLSNPGTANETEASLYSSQKERELNSKADFDLVDARELQATIPIDIDKQRNTVAEFEDDLFDGVDLDALEAEAAQTCRIRSQKNVNLHHADVAASLGVLTAQVSGTTASRSRLLSRLPNDDKYGGCPSFDLGIAD